jgi:hypothetical protein
MTSPSNNQLPNTKSHPNTESHPSGFRTKRTQPQGHQDVTKHNRSSAGSVALASSPSLAAIFACTANATTGPRPVLHILTPSRFTPLPLSALPAARVGPESGQNRKTWSYAYDKNNNMTSESFPKPAAALAGDYANTMAYDALDRMTSRLVGKRSLTTTDEALFGSRTYVLVGRRPQCGWQDDICARI